MICDKSPKRAVTLHVATLPQHCHTQSDASFAALPRVFSLRVCMCARRATIEGILSDAQKGLEKAVPVPEVREMDSLLRATVKATLDMLDESATILNEGEGAKVGVCIACEREDIDERERQAHT